mmetsp:Transcript_30365/g.42634  ORF Transcript_30365/g.42634 Transcript_30365/m.42634 type:complete len:85 (-) Transcript_30365:66-320(-)
MKRNEKRREMEQNTKLRELGLTTAIKTKHTETTQEERLKQMRGNRRGDRGVGDGTKGLQLSVGRWRDGVLHVNKNKFNKRKGRK